MSADGSTREPGGGGTLLGALLILLAGVALGAAWNTLGLASRPPWGIAWIRPAPTATSLEALQPPGAVAAATTAAPAPDSTTRAARPAAPPPRPATTVPRMTAGAAPRPVVKPAPRLAHAQDSVPQPTEPPALAPAEPVAPAAAAPPATTPRATVAPLPVIPDVPGPLTIELATFKHLYDAGRVLVVDARERSQYEYAHLAGAVSLPFDGVLAEREKVRQLDAGGRAFVVYCSGGTCELSMDLAKVLVESGKRKVLVFEGGYPAWEAAGYPVEHGPGIEP